MKTPKGKKCFCGHYMKDHTKYIGGANSKGCVFVCTKDGCGRWNLCDLGLEVKNE